MRVVIHYAFDSFLRNFHEGYRLLPFSNFYRRSFAQ